MSKKDSAQDVTNLIFGPKATPKKASQSEWSEQPSRRQQPPPQPKKRPASRAGFAVPKQKRAKTEGTPVEEFLCTTKYRARLPAPPLSLKFLKIPHAPDRFTRFCATNLELNYKWDLHHATITPVPFNMLDPNSYEPEQPNGYEGDLDYDSYYREEFHPDDKKLITMLRARNEKRAGGRQTNPGYVEQPWMLHTQFLTASTNESFVKKKESAKIDIQTPGRRDLEEDALTRALKTFQDIGDVDVLSHPRKHGVTVKSHIPVYPNNELLNTKYCQVTFNHNPSTQARKLPTMPDTKRANAAAARDVIRHCILRHTIQEDAKSDSKNLDWYSLYAPTPSQIQGVVDDGDVVRELLCDWVCEYVPSKKKVEEESIFLTIQKGDERDGQEAFYARSYERMQLRHRPTDPVDDKGTMTLTSGDQKYLKSLPERLLLEFEDVGMDD